VGEEPYGIIAHVAPREIDLLQLQAVLREHLHDPVCPCSRRGCTQAMTGNETMPCLYSSHSHTREEARRQGRKETNSQRSMTCRFGVNWRINMTFSSGILVYLNRKK